jgi:hypothetical protein
MLMFREALHLEQLAGNNQRYIDRSDTLPPVEPPWADKASSSSSFI